MSDPIHEFRELGWRCDRCDKLPNLVPIRSLCTKLSLLAPHDFADLLRVHKREHKTGVVRRFRHVKYPINAEVWGGHWPDRIPRTEEGLCDQLFFAGLHAVVWSGSAFAREIGSAAYKNEKDHFSVDEFLYARCCVVANGREFFETVLAAPSEMPKDVDFEALLYAAAQAYELKTGEEFDYTTQTPFETFSNPKGWASA